MSKKDELTRRTVEMRMSVCRVHIKKRKTTTTKNPMWAPLSLGLGKSKCSSLLPTSTHASRKTNSKIHKKQIQKSFT